jgi:hypothetical protein
MLETQHDSCETKGSCLPSHEQAHGKCPCGCGCDHECPMHMWTTAFFCAKKAVMVDILKNKIQKAKGQKLEQTADLILQAMEAKIKGKFELKAKLEEIWQEK